MNVGQYRAMLADLELKRAEVTQVHDQYAFGYAKTVLAEARDKLQVEIDNLLNLELMPVPVVVSISSSQPSLVLSVGGNAQLTITATMSDGSTRDVTKGLKTVATFRDSDTGYNNSGFITAVDASEFTTATKVKLTIVKTASGWHIDSDSSTLFGLDVSPLGDNQYGIVDIDGNPIGVKFTTNGNEVKGDNWIIEVEGVPSGTEYSTSDEAVATVDPNGNVYAVGSGTANITVTNNGNTIVIPVTVA